MKVKKDKFLAAACADLDLETATREHYGYKDRASTTSDASYTIVAKAHVGGRMASSRRRSFLTARPNSVQKGTASSKKDPLKAKMNRAAKKSMKGKHSYVTSADEDSEYDEKEIEETKEEKERENIKTPEDSYDPEKVSEEDEGVTDNEAYLYGVMIAAGKTKKGIKKWVAEYRRRHPEMREKTPYERDIIHSSRGGPIKDIVTSAARPGPNMVPSVWNPKKMIPKVNPIGIQAKHDREYLEYKKEWVRWMEKNAHEFLAPKAEEEPEIQKEALKDMMAEIEKSALYDKLNLKNMDTKEKAVSKRVQEELDEKIKNEELATKDRLKKTEEFSGRIAIDPKTREILTGWNIEQPDNAYSPEASARMAQTAPFKNDQLDEMENEAKAWSIMQWIANGNAGKLAQAIVTSVRGKEDEEYESKKRRLNKTFEGDYSYGENKPDDWKLNENDVGAVKAQVMRATKGVLTPEQSEMIFSLVDPSLPLEAHKFYNIRERLLQMHGTPEGRELFNNIAKTKTMDPLETGAGYIWGTRAAEARKKRYTQNQETSDKWYLNRDRSWGHTFDTEPANRAKAAMGRYPKTEADRDQSDIDSDMIDGDLDEDNVFSWEGKDEGQQPEGPSMRDIADDPNDPSGKLKLKRFAAYSKLKKDMEIPRSTEEEKLRKSIRRAMNDSSIRYKMEQYVAAKERMGELVDRDKVKFLVVMKENPNLASLIDGTIPGGTDKILGEMDDAFNRGNAELFADPLSKINPAKSDISGAKHIAGFRRYLALLKHATATTNNISLDERGRRAAQPQKGGISDNETRNFLSAYKNAISDVESKIWENRGVFDTLSIKLRESLDPKNGVPDTEIEKLEQGLTNNALEHRQLINTAAEYTQRFFHATRPTNAVNEKGERVREAIAPLVLRKAHENAGDMFTHKTVKKRMLPEKIAANAQGAFRLSAIPSDTYKHLFPKRAVSEAKREREANARARLSGFIADKMGILPVDVPKEEVGQMRETNYRQMYDSLPWLYKGKQLLNKYLIKHPKIQGRLTPAELEDIKKYTGVSNPLPKDVVIKFKELDSSIKNIESMLPKSLYAKYLKENIEEHRGEREKELAQFTEQTRNDPDLSDEQKAAAIEQRARVLERFGVSEVDQALMVNAAHPDRYGSMSSEAGGIIGHKDERRGAYLEGKNIENDYTRRSELFHNQIMESGTAGGKAHHEISKLVDDQRLTMSLAEIKQGYIRAAMNEVRAKLGKPKNLRLGQDGKSFVYDLPDGKAQTVPYTGKNLLYANMLAHYTKISHPEILKEIESLTAAQKNNGGILSLVPRMQLNMAKLIYAVSDETKVGDNEYLMWAKGTQTKDRYGTPKPLKQELWEIGRNATGHGTAGMSRATWKRLLPDDGFSYRDSAIDTNVGQLNHVWERYNSRMPDEMRDIDFNFRSPMEDARVKLQMGARNVQESPENEILKRLLSEINPPKTMGGEIPRGYNRTLNRPDYETPQESWKKGQPTEAKIPEPSGQFNLENKPAFTGRAAIPPTKKASPKLGDLSSKPQTQTSLSETADVVDRFLAQNKKLEFHTQGGDGSGEGMQAVIGAPHPVHPLEIFMRRGAKRDMQNLQPMTQMTQRISENVIPQTNAKNNKAGVDLSMRRKSGSFPGQKPWSILHKMLITPKDYKIDGGLRG